MFDFNRLKLLLLRTWQLSPSWYLFVPPLAFIAVLVFAVTIEGTDSFERFGSTDDIFFTPDMLSYVLIYANAISLTIIGTHLISRHFKDNQQQTDTFTLPVSDGERFLVLILACFVLLPLYGILSNFLAFGLVKTLGIFGYYPRWGWMSSRFSFAILPYIALMIPYFALSFIRSRQTILWGIGVAALFGGIVALSISGDTQYMESIVLNASEISNLPTGDDVLYGPGLSEDASFTVNPFFAVISSQKSLAFFYLSVATILLFLSSWYALKNRQA